ncbi:MAG: response regulator [Methanocellales archaeon]
MERICCEKCDFFVECIKGVEKIELGELRKILLVEDNEDHMILIKKVLIDKLDVDCAMTGKEALKKLVEHQYDMILLDYKLPDISGIEVLTNLKQKGLNIPTIIITGAGSEEVAVEAMKLGAMDYIVKSKDYYAQLPQYLVTNFQKFKLEQKIKEIRKSLKNIAESSADIILSIDFEDKINSCNEAVEKNLGWKKEELIGEKIDKLFPNQALAKINEVKEKLRKGVSIRDFEIQCYHKNGSIMVFSFTVSPIKNAAGKIIGASAIGRDITVKKKIEHRIAQAEKEIEIYAKLLCNDIYNMNQIAIGYLTLLVETEKLTGEQKKLIMKTMDSIKSSLKLIDKVGKLYKSKKNVDEILREIVSEFSEIAKSKESK